MQKTRGESGLVVQGLAHTFKCSRNGDFVSREHLRRRFVLPYRMRGLFASCIECHCVKTACRESAAWVLMGQRDNFTPKPPSRKVCCECKNALYQATQMTCSRHSSSAVLSSSIPSVTTDDFVRMTFRHVNIIDPAMEDEDLNRSGMRT